jgi:hypothetical protein
LTFVYDALADSFLYRAVWVVLVLGVIAIGYSLVEMRLALGASEKPQRLTLAQLAANGPGDNAHVVLTDFALCDGYVCLVKVGRYERLTDGTDTKNRRWEGVFVPVVPLSPEVQQQQGRGAAPANVRVLLLSYTVHGEADLDRLGAQPEVRGMVINSIKSLDGKTESLLREMYPGTDFSTCLIFQEKRKPTATMASLLLVLLGTCLTVGSALLLVVRHVYRPPGS